METAKLKRPTDWFRIHCFKDLSKTGNDSLGSRPPIERKELIVSLDQYPYGFGLGPNPRRPDLTSRVSQSIEESLKTDGDNFHLLSRGITIVAKALEHDNKTDKVRLTLAGSEAEDRFFGILDGGNTDARINKYREELLEDEAREKLPRRFVNVQVLIPNLDGSDIPTGKLETLLNDIKEARNTSVQVKEKSLADARRQFDLLKEVLKDEPYFGEISWRQGDKGSIDAQFVLTLLMIYFPPFCESADGREPSNAYGHKERCLDAYLEYANSKDEGVTHTLEAWIKLLPVIIRFFDHLQKTLASQYSGSFGKIKEVQIFDEKKFERGNKKYRKTAAHSQFLGAEMKYQYPIGWLYPIFAAFRVLVAPKKDTGELEWKRDPIAFWDKNGKELCRRFEPHLNELGFEPKKVATSLICYQAMSSAVKELFKDELLTDAGIAF